MSFQSLQTPCSDSVASVLPLAGSDATAGEDKPTVSLWAIPLLPVCLYYCLELCAYFLISHLPFSIVNYLFLAFFAVSDDGSSARMRHRAIAHITAPTCRPEAPTSSPQGVWSDWKLTHSL